MADLSSMTTEQLEAELKRLKAEVYGVPVESGLEPISPGWAKNQTGQVFQKNSAGTFDRKSGPNDTQVTKAMDANGQLNNALAALDAVDQIATQKKPMQGPLGKWLINRDDFAQLQSAVRDFQIQMKEAYNLGALTGPDMAFIDSMATDPKSLEAMFLQGTLKPKLKQLAAAMGNRYRTAEDRFAGIGGNPQALPPLFQSPRSQYKPDEWGHSGRVPKKKTGGPMPPPAKPATSVTTGTGKVVKIEVIG